MKVLTVDMGRVMLQVEATEMRRLSRACGLLAEQMQQQQREADTQILESWTSLLELAGHMAQMQQTTPDVARFESSVLRANGSAAAAGGWGTGATAYDEEEDKYEKR